MRRNARISITLAVLGLLACQGERLAGGGTDQPNEIAGVVQSGTGSSLPGARIQLRRGPFQPDTDMAFAWNPASLLAETLGNAQGGFRFRNVPAGTYFLDIVSGDTAQVAIVPIPLPANGGFSPGSIRLSEAATLSGKILSAGSPAFSLHLAGTHYQALVGEKGSFRFPPLVPGRYRLTVRSVLDAGPGYLLLDGLDLKAGDAVVLDSLRLPPDSVALFDFDRGRVRSLLGGRLYPLRNDTAGRIRIDDAPIDSVPVDSDAAPLSIVTAGAFRGASLRISAQPGRGYRFTVGSGFYDFSRVTSISLWARTSSDSASFRIGFSSEAVAQGSGSFYAQCMVGPQWSRIVILPEDIHPEGAIQSQGLTWDKVNARINLITLYPGSVSELFLDDIHLLGVSYGSLPPR